MPAVPACPAIPGPCGGLVPAGDLPAIRLASSTIGPGLPVERVLESPAEKLQGGPARGEDGDRVLDCFEEEREDW